MRIRASLACLVLLGSMAVLPLAWADAASKSAKIAELLQLTGARQFLYEIDGKYDQEEAVRAWGRYYSENVTEADLDGILAYYRSPAGQKDVSASRAALGQVQRYMREKHVPIATAVVADAPVGAPVTRPATAGGSGDSVGPAPASRGASPVEARTSAAATAAARPVESAPRAPDGRVVPSPSSPEQCEVTPTAPVGAHAGSGRSVVCVCTDEKGALTRDPVIAESSGDPRVDSGALKMARVDSGRYSPPTLNGQPQSACFRFAIDFGHHQ
jgi:Uncharacterized protein conserved in bacteria (DUF2059)